MASLPPLQTRSPNPPSKKKNTLLFVALGLCAASFLCVGVVSAVLLPVFARAKEAASLNVCRQHIGQVGDAVKRYAAQTGKFPNSIEDAKYYAKSNAGDMKCPKMELLFFGIGYAYNSAVYGGKTPYEISEEVYDKEPMLIEVFDARKYQDLMAESRFPKRHLNGRYITAYYYRRGAVEIRLTDDQMNANVKSTFGQLQPTSTEE